MSGYPDFSEAECVTGSVAAHCWDIRASPPQRLKAIAACGKCVVLAACGTWFSELPKSQQPSGVVAGKLQGKLPAGRSA